MSTKMEQLLDLIVNEEMDKANELFHEIVVEKSREIYENLIAEEADEEDESVEEDSDEEDESVEEDSDEEDESVEEGFGMNDDESSSEIGGDAADDFGADIEDPEAMGGDEQEIGDGEPASKADVLDLKDALEELTREFEALISGDESDDEEGDDEEGDEEADDETEFDSEEDDKDEESMGFVREYRETVGNDWHKNSMKSPGPVGSGTGDKAGQTSVDGGKSPVSSGKGKPTTGASAHNILQGGTGEGENTGTSPNGKTGGLVGGVKGQFTKGVEKNIAASSKTGMKSGSAMNRQGSGYPGNNKAPGPVGSGTGDKAGQTSVGKVVSPLNGAPNRNA
jgi:hypothetical protein